METLRERLAELVARKVLVLPPDHDRRGMYFEPTPEPTPRGSSCAAPHTPHIDD